MLFFCVFLLFTSYNEVSSQSTETFPPNSLNQAGAIFPMGGSIPTSRVHHSIVATDSYIIVYGGYDEDGGVTGDINLYHMLSQKWSNPITRIQCCNEVGSLIETIGLHGDYVLPYIGVGFEGDAPLSRAEHTACTVGNDMYVFGGVTTPYGYAQDLYKFDTTGLTWKSITHVVGPMPSRRAGHSMVSDPTKNLLYLFGGRTMRQGKDYALNDMWMYNITSASWSMLTVSSSTKSVVPLIPSHRQHAAMVLINNKVFLFGGMDPRSNIAYNDVWVYNIGISSWKLLSRNSGSNFGFSPPPLYHCMIIPILSPNYNANNTAVEGFLVYGGIGGGGLCADVSCRLHTVIGQVYRFSFTTNKWDVPVRVSETGTASEERYLNSTASWNYARLSSSGATGVDKEINDRGKLIKLFAMERAVFVGVQNRLYEFGGLVAASSSLMADGQSTSLLLDESDGSNEVKSAILNAGGNLIQPGGDRSKVNLWDQSTGEQLRNAVDTPTNGVWDKSFAFLGVNSSVSILRAFRIYSVNPVDIVLMTESFA
jgi:hypothetical protein